MGSEAWEETQKNSWPAVIRQKKDKLVTAVLPGAIMNKRGEERYIPKQPPNVKVYYNITKSMATGYHAHLWLKALPKINRLSLALQKEMIDLNMCGKSINFLAPLVEYLKTVFFSLELNRRRIKQNNSQIYSTVLSSRCVLGLFMARA